MTNRNLYSFYRVFIIGLQHFVRNSWLTLAATLIMVVTISFVLAGVILNSVFQRITSDLSQSITISVYLEKQGSEAEQEVLQTELLNHPSVTQVLFVDSQVARGRFIAIYGDDVAIRQAIDLVGGDIFPDALEISVDDLDALKEVATVAEAERYDPVVESVSLGKTDAQKAIERAVSLQNGLIRVSIGISAVFLTVAALIIFNTIRMTIFARREEIQIMRLIGAPAYFIREPFLVEAGLYGLSGGILAACLIYGLIWFFGDTILSVPELASSYAYFVQDKGVIVLVFAGASSGGTMVGVLSCGLALRRHLRL